MALIRFSDGLYRLHYRFKPMRYTAYGDLIGLRDRVYVAKFTFFTLFFQSLIFLVFLLGMLCSCMIDPRIHLIHKI